MEFLRKESVFGQFSVHFPPLPDPLQNANFISIVVSASLNKANETLRFFFFMQRASMQALIPREASTLQPWGPKAHWLVSPDFLPPARCDFSHSRKGKRPTLLKRIPFEKGHYQGIRFKKAVFPFSRGKNRISQGVENRGSLISVPS